MSKMVRIALFISALPIIASCQTHDADSTDSSNSLNQTEHSYAEGAADTLHTQNPTKALFKSIFIPGWGQLGNKKYVKAGIIISMESTFMVNLIHFAKKTSDARREFDSETDTTNIAGLYNRYKSAKDDRNLYSWLTGTVIFISMFDAYVDAHLAQFPKIDDRLSVRLDSGDGAEWMVKLNIAS